jgi:hypothetical protein
MQTQSVAKPLVHVARVPAWQHRGLRIMAARDNTTVQSHVEMAILWYLEDHGGPEVAKLVKAAAKAPSRRPRRPRPDS